MCYYFRGGKIYLFVGDVEDYVDNGQLFLGYLFFLVLCIENFVIINFEIKFYYLNCFWSVKLEFFLMIFNREKDFIVLIMKC